jgi:hypothetical protein
MSRQESREDLNQNCRLAVKNGCWNFCFDGAGRLPPRRDPHDTQPPQAPIERRDVLQPADRVFREAQRTDMDVFTNGLGRAVHFGLNRGV